MSVYFTSVGFWKDALERAVKSFAQGAVALLSADGLGLFGVNWMDVFSVAGLMALLSILTSLASGPVGSGNNASLVKLIAFVTLTLGLIGGLQ